MMPAMDSEKKHVSEHDRLTTKNAMLRAALQAIRNCGGGLDPVEAANKMLDIARETLANIEAADAYAAYKHNPSTTRPYDEFVKEWWGNGEETD